MSSTRNYFCAVTDRVFNQFIHLFNGGIIDKRTNGYTVFATITNFQCGNPGAEFFQEFVINAVLDKHPVCTHTSLPRIAIF